MSDVVVDITVSLDGFVTGPNDGPAAGLGEGGEVLHYWVFGGPWTYDSLREMEPVGVDRQIFDEFENSGASVVGRRMYDLTDGWGGSPPFDLPCVVLTHRVGEQPEAPTKFAFVAGIEAAISRAHDLADGRDIYVGGGASTCRQALQAGLVDRLNLHVAPVLLGAGRPLFGDLGMRIHLEHTRTLESPYATHLSYRVTRSGE